MRAPAHARRLLPWLLALLVMVGAAVPAMGQSGTRGVRLLGMNGGAASLARGTDALFSNPANLTAGERDRALEIRFLDVRVQTGGSLLQFNHYSNAFTEGNSLTPDEVESTLDAWFGDEQRTTVGHVSAVPLAVAYRSPSGNWSVGGGLRLQTTVTSGLNRGVFDLLLRGTGQTRSIPIDGRYRAYSTIDLTGAVSYRFEAAGLSIGMAPRLILGAGIAEGKMASTLDVGEQSLTHTFDYTARAAGVPSSAVYDSFNAFDADLIGDMSGTSLRPAGKGAGLDVGVTFEAPSGFNVSASVTDLGFIQWDRQAQTITPASNVFQFDGVAVNTDRIRTEFDGSVGDYFEHKLDSLARAAYEDVNRTPGSFRTGLPTAVHVGTGWQGAGGAISAGVSMGLNERAGAVPAAPVVYLGGEYMLGPLPLRAGVRALGDRAASVSVGTGLHLGGYAIDVGGSLTPSSSTLGGGARYAVGVSVATLRF